METHTETTALAAARAAYQAAISARMEDAPDLGAIIKELRQEIDRRADVLPGLILSKRYSAEEAARQTAQLFQAVKLLKLWRSPGLLNGEGA